MKGTMRFVLIAALAIALLPLAGVRAQDPVTIRVTNWAGVDEAAEFQALVDEVNANNTEFQVVYEPKPDDYYTQLQTQLAGGTAADLFWLDQNHMEWAYDGALLDISDYLANDDREVANPEDYFPGVWQTVAINDGIYGLPWIAQPVVLYYNKDIFDAMGMEYPTAEWTWDDFRAAAEALTNEEHYGFTLNSWPPIHMFIWSFGGEVISEDLQSSPIDSPEAIAGAQLYADMIYNESCCPSEETIAEEGFGEMFKAGRVAMFMGGAADDLDRVEGLNVGVSPVPQGPTGENVTFTWTAATAINADTENPDLAYEAMIQLTEATHEWKIVSPRVSQATAEHLVASEPRKEANAAGILEAVPDMRAFRIVPRHAEWDQIFWEDFQDPLFHGEDTVENLAADATILLQDVLGE